MDLDQKATEDLAKTAVWSQDSLGYAREHGQPKLLWLLKAVEVEVELEGELLALPLGQHLGSEQGISSRNRDERAERCQEDLVQERARARKREQAEEKNRAQQAAAWERFMHTELRELELRKDGQLAEQLGEPLPGEPSAALQHLVSEDRRQAEEGFVALMSQGKVSYKRLDELSEKDMPARIAANRARTTWLKERRDRWLGRGLVS